MSKQSWKPPSISTGCLLPSIVSAGPASYIHAFRSAGLPRPQGGIQAITGSPPLAGPQGMSHRNERSQAQRLGLQTAFLQLSTNLRGSLGPENDPLQIDSTVNTDFFRTLHVYRWLFENIWETSNKTKNTRIMSHLSVPSIWVSQAYSSFPENCFQGTP